MIKYFSLGILSGSLSLYNMLHIFTSVQRLFGSIPDCCCQHWVFFIGSLIAERFLKNETRCALVASKNLLLSLPLRWSKVKIVIFRLNLAMLVKVRFFYSNVCMSAQLSLYIKITTIVRQLPVHPQCICFKFHAIFLPNILAYIIWKQLLVSFCWHLSVSSLFTASKLQFSRNKTFFISPFQNFAKCFVAIFFFIKSFFL